MKNRKKIDFGIEIKELKSVLDKRIPEIHQKAMQDVAVAVSKGLKGSNKIEQVVTAETKAMHGVVNRYVATEIDKLKVQIQSIDLQKIAAQIKKELSAKSGQRSAAEVSVERCQLTYNWSQHWKSHLVITTLCAFDSAVNAPSYQAWGSQSLLGSILISIACAVGLAVSAHTIGFKIRNATNTWLRRMWFALGIIGASVVFYLLGDLRHTFLGGTTFIHSPVAWMIFCDFFFIVALVFSSSRMPTKKQYEEWEKWKAARKKLKEILAEEKRIEEKYSEAKRKVTKLKAEQQELVTYRDRNVSYIDKEGDKIIADVRNEFELLSADRKNGV